MRDDPRQNVNWLAQELLAAERPSDPEGITDDTAELLAQVDELLEQMEDPEPPVFVSKGNKYSKGQRAERAHISRQFDANSAVLTKTKRQLRKEARQQKAAEKKSHVNNKIGGLMFLAALECIGILWIIGWWLQ